MTRPCMVQVTSGKQHSLTKAKYPGTVKDGLVSVEHAGGVLQVLQAAIISMAWGPEDPESLPAAKAAEQPKAAAGKAP